MSVFDSISKGLSDIGKSVVSTVSDIAEGVLDGFNLLGTSISKALGLKSYFDDLFSLPPSKGYQIQSNLDTSIAVPIVYGKAKVGLKKVHFEISEDYKHLHCFYFVCEHDGASIEKIYIEGQSGKDAEWVYDVASNTTNQNTRFNNKVIFKVSDGINGFGTYPTDNGCTTYTTAMKFSRVLAVYARFSYDSNIYQGEPQLYCIVNGKTSNPAAALRDYMTNDGYGVGLQNIDTASFDYAEALCDEDVGGRKRYTFNGIIDTKRKIQDNRDDILRSMVADIRNDNGVYAISLRGQGDAVYTFNESNIVGTAKLSTASSTDAINAVTADYISPDQNYKEDSVFYDSSNIVYPFAGWDSDVRLLRDDSISKEKRIKLNFCNNFAEAQATAEYILKKSLFNKVVELNSNWSAGGLNIGDIVGVTLDHFGFADKEFRVESKEYQLDGIIKFTLEEHDDRIYSIEYENQYPSQGVNTLPNPFDKPSVVTITNIDIVGKGKANIYFDELNSGLVDKYVAKITKGAQVYTFESNMSPIYVEVQDVGDYSAVVYAVSDLQIDGLQNTPTAYQVVDKPNPPTNMTVTIEDRQMKIKWDAVSLAIDNQTPIEVDHYNVYRFDQTGTQVGYYETKADVMFLPAVAGINKFKLDVVTVFGRRSNPDDSVYDITIYPPIVNGFTAQVIDNNVTFKVEMTKGTLPTDKVILLRDGVVVNESSTAFIYQQEVLQGSYNYQIKAVDIVGNVSNVVSQIIQVDAPRDYTSRLETVSDFSGSKTNAVIDDNGNLMLPVSTTDTVSDWIGNGYATIQDEINAGFLYGLMPEPLTAQYQEVFDIGFITQSLVRVQVTETDEIISNITEAFLMEFSTDAIDWVTMPNSTAKIVNMVGFRYVRITFDYSGNGSELYKLTTISIRIYAKTINDDGDGVTDAAGHATVYFNEHFASLKSIILTQNSTVPSIILLDHTAGNNTDFNVITYDLNGNTLGNVNFNWSARGYK